MMSFVDNIQLVTSPEKPTYHLPRFVMIINLDNVSLLIQDYVLNDALFRVFDEDNSGTLNFFEWFQASNVKNMATIEEKLNWIFTAFDADGGGTIDPDEITEIVKWMFRFAGNYNSFPDELYFNNFCRHRAGSRPPCLLCD